MRDYEKELKEDLTYGRKNGFKVVLVEANSDKGFNYSYFVYIPNNPQNTLMMDCLNDYEDEMPEGQIENLEGLEEIYSLFSWNFIKTFPKNYRIASYHNCSKWLIFLVFYIFISFLFFILRNR